MKKPNQIQKFILGIFIPIILFIIAHTILTNYMFFIYPFQLSYTWKIWLAYLIIVGYIEYKIFS